MTDLAVLVLLLEQGNHSLEDHIIDFVFLANLTHYPDSCLCSFSKLHLIPPHKRSCPAKVLERASPPGARAHPVRPVEVTVGREGAMETPTHCTATEGELRLNLGTLHMEQDLINFYGDLYEVMPPLPPSSELSVFPEVPTCLDFPPILPLLSPSIVPAASVLPPLSPGSPSAHPQPTICAMGSPQVCQFPSASWLENPSYPPPVSESWTPAWPSDPGGPPWLPAPSPPPSAHQLHWAPSSLRLRLGRSSSRHRLRTPLLWLRLVALSPRLCWAPPSLQLRLSPLSLRPWPSGSSEALNGLAPAYLTSLLPRYNPSRSLGSQNSGLLVVPRIAKSTKGGRAFSHLAPKL
ncbi:Streptococcal surface protein A [Labeo rohita]|uniref:Streptococcal surface protein A n=1 Tax=Labeo rohita TaxID=84645 RepID=A0ABQ8LZK4_LABRO|nr:Streptococcal surface protein A [Labeo rohita]